MKDSKVKELIFAYCAANKKNKKLLIHRFFLFCVAICIVVSILVVGKAIEQKKEELASAKNEHADIYSSAKYIWINKDKLDSHDHQKSILSASHSLVNELKLGDSLSGITPSKSFDSKKNVSIHLVNLSPDDVILFLEKVHKKNYISIHKFEMFKSMADSKMIDLNVVLTSET